MAMQSTIPDTTTCLLRSATAVLIGIVAMAFVSIIADLLLNALDSGVPWRQLTLNRMLNGLVLSCQVFCAILCSYIFARLWETNGPRIERMFASGNDQAQS